jgi:hypothetical protein
MISEVLDALYEGGNLPLCREVVSTIPDSMI